MQNPKFSLPLKVGLLLATLSWFSWVFFDFNIGIFNRHTTFPTIIEDIPGIWGVGFRMVAATILIIIVVLFVILKEFSRAEATTAFRFALIFEAFYFAGFLGGALNVWKRDYFTLPRILEQGLPCFVMGILLPAVLIKLFFELNPNKPKKGAIKWALIYLSAFLFVYWLNNMGYWVATVISKGTDYITQYPINLLSFTVTIAGLLLLFLYAADFSSKWLRTGTLEKLNLKKVAAVVTLLGLYPLFTLLLWLFFGSVGGWGTWYAWFLGHGYMTFIAIPIPFISLPLLFRTGTRSEEAKPGAEKQKMLNLDRKRVTPILFATQTLGILFFIIFSLAYYIPFPSTKVLIGTEPFLPLLQIFGTLFFISTLSVLALSFATKIDN